MSDRPPKPPRQERWDRRMEVPLAVASLLFLAGYAVRVLARHGLPRVWLDLCLALTLAAWALFVVDYAVRLRLSGLGPFRFLRAHLLDTVVMLLPLLRPVRMVSVYERIQRRRDRPRLGLYARVMVYSGLSVALLGFAGALTVYRHEVDAPGASIRTFGDAVWWTCATLATVGYGDVAPVTPVGRVTAVGLMACGLALLGAVTGSFSSWLIQVFTREDEKRPPGSPPGA
ncbi:MULTISPECIES: potassium channel family protein [unclassified Streptomyces]|uniref:potassium channel family protein n=1 Tax=unclassified Streptomyces TaxID=2593676 RepID=UPI001660566A|nr:MULTISPECIES: potassium channel family protein [unclassified Streptomyces]MBD0707924.1 ion transporter [Streptomyces sp. CBMA291]MBD0711742.1 ion transporter [Streptomyces sp. CBMA291]MBD0716444.1 ion transporter [Streptomyces sp. CBMA370]